MRADRRCARRGRGGESTGRPLRLRLHRRDARAPSSPVPPRARPRGRVEPPRSARSGDLASALARRRGAPARGGIRRRRRWGSASRRRGTPRGGRSPHRRAPAGAHVDRAGNDGSRVQKPAPRRAHSRGARKHSVTNRLRDVASSAGQNLRHEERIAARDLVKPVWTTSRRAAPVVDRVERERSERHARGDSQPEGHRAAGAVGAATQPRRLETSGRAATVQTRACGRRTSARRALPRRPSARLRTRRGWAWRGARRGASRRRASRPVSDSPSARNPAILWAMS